MSVSIIKYYGKLTRDNCGYCKQKNSSHSHGMHAYTLTPEDYQDLINLGWRRSGNYCYKQTNSTTCCPSYTIKCDTVDFKLSKSHKKTLKRVNKFLKDGIKDKTQSHHEEADGDRGGNLERETEPSGVEEIDIAVDKISDDEKLTKSKVSTNLRPQGNRSNIELKSAGDIINSDSKSQNDNSDSIDATVEATKSRCKKAKQIRFERKKAKLEARGVPFDSIPNKSPRNTEKSLDDYINEVSDNDCHKLKLRQIEVNSDEFFATSDEAFKLYTKYQSVIHNDPPHNKELFLNFLQKSPIKLSKPDDGPPDGYGSFHQQYWLDDKLIAVGVIDILPYCISSVYFFYDPDFSFLTLGTYSSLREIHFTNNLSKTVPALKYYYMGFYIHSCPKMRYKGRLTASYLLCPEKYTWHILTDEIRAKLDARKYQVFNENESIIERFTRADLDAVLIHSKSNNYTSYKRLKTIHRLNLDKTLLEYADLVGKECALRMIFVNII